MLRQLFSPARRHALGAIASRSAVSLPQFTIAPSPQAIIAAALSTEASIPSPEQIQAKYAKKLEERAQQEGYTSVDALLDASRTKRRHEELRERLENQTKLVEEISADKLPPHVTPLSKIMVMEKIQDQPADIIEKLWIGYHASKKAVCAVISRDIYLDMHENAKKYPTFVLPLFDEDQASATTYLLQHAGHQTFFTTLDAYRVHQAEAPAVLTLTYYTDLIESKGIVLVHGDVDLDRLSLLGAKQLTEGMRNFYIGDGAVLVEKMHADPQNFSYQDVVDVVRAIMRREQADSSVSQPAQ